MNKKEEIREIIKKYNIHAKDKKLPMSTRIAYNWMAFGLDKALDIINNKK